MASTLENAVHPSFRFEVEPTEVAELGLRRYRWLLKAGDEDLRFSSESFATKREATKAGEIALERARQRGVIFP